MRLILLLACLLPVVTCAEEAPIDADALFAHIVHPLFVRKCGGCHGEDAQEIQGEFDMRNRDALLRGGESSLPAIDFDDVDSSPLLAAIRWEDGLEMPPKENDRLTAEEIASVRTWISAGAPWPEKSDPVWNAVPSGKGVRVTTSGGQGESWTNRLYDPDDLWAFQPITHPEPPAAPNGESLHPIDAFIGAKLREQSLTLAEGADARTLIRRVSFGLTGLPPTPEQITEFEQTFATDPNAAWDALIERLLGSPHYGERMAQHWLDVTRYADSSGFSRDSFRPGAHRYRTYVIESFNDDTPYNRFVKEQLAGDELKIADQEALGFLWMGPWEHTAMSVKAVTRQQWLDDVTNSVGVTFLGQQLRCAKCHDHKFDPIPTRDYYAVQAAFAATTHTNRAGFAISSQKPEAIHVLPGGSLDSPGEEVGPGVLSALASTSEVESPRVWKSRRAAFAEWVADANNPLTPRVIVNRVWQMHFGTGLVATPNDFGKMGADPTHPELLDWLASEFVASGWSVKKLQRLILTSRTYQQADEPTDILHASNIDPQNKLLSHFPSRRLSVEEIRDAMLSASGELNPAVGGPSVYPEINWEVAFQPRLLMGKLAPPYEPSPKRSDRHRRSLYAVRLRGLGDPFMEVFDRPGSETSCERRTQTSVTPQAFTLMHGEFAHDRALAVADRAAQENTSPKERVAAVYRAILGRAPTERQRTLSVEHLAQMTKLHASHPLTPQKLPTSIVLNGVRERDGQPMTQTFQLKKLKQYEDDLRPWEVTPDVRALADLCLVLFNSSEFLFVY